MNSRMVACELLSIAVCNMDCRYCYIPKKPVLKEIQQKIVEQIESGEFIQHLQKVYGDRLEYLGFWGTEPTLVLDKLSEKMPQVIPAFPRLKGLKFSTNLLAFPERIAQWVETVARINPKLEIDFQVSLDGPEWVTDENRQEGATEKILKNYEYLIGEFSRMDIQNKVSFSFKPTVSGDNIQRMVQEPTLIQEWFQFFENLIELWQTALAEKRNFIVKPSGVPSLVVPGQYTVEDGRNLAQFFRLCKELEQKKLFTRLGPNLNLYTMRFRRTLLWWHEVQRKSSMLTCSGGDSNHGMGLEGELHICHSSFFWNYPGFLDEQLGRRKIAVERYIAPPEGKEFARFNYIMRCYHDFFRTKIAYAVAMLKELAATGQVSPVYGKSTEIAMALGMFVNTALSCPAENLYGTGVTHFAPASLFRMFGNGAFEEILREILSTAEGFLRAM